jgi:hypothetical protein
MKFHAQTVQENKASSWFCTVFSCHQFYAWVCSHVLEFDISYPDQGDQIGRIFAYWAIVYFEQFIKLHRRSPDIWTAYFHEKSYVLILPKKWVGLHFQRLIWSP